MREANKHLSDAIHALLIHCQSPAALKLHNEAVRAQRARRDKEEADLEAGETTE